MYTHRKLQVLLSILLLASMLFGSSGLVSARPADMPMAPVDESKVPHYFGPYPNWANSPFTLPDVNVEIVGDGAGATAVAGIDPNGAITGITVTNPGVGYTTATVNITGTGTGAQATAQVAHSGVVTSIALNAPGAGYTNPSVSFSGGGGTGVLTQVGNALIERAYATDYESVPPVRVLVIVPGPLPSGTLKSFQTLNQALPGGSPTPSAGQSFNAYVLRPQGGNDYNVLFDSGTLTVPALADPLVSEITTFPVPDVAVQAGDVIAFYGAGIPVDTGSGADIFMFPAPAAPTLGSTITAGSGAYPLYGQARTYSFAASVVDANAATPVTNATATAYGGVDTVTLVSAGDGYTMPTVDFDLPDDPNGIVAKAHAVLDTTTGAITEVVVDDPGSGYLAPPNVVIRDGTLFDPITHTGNVATAEASLKITAITLDSYGAGYVTAPTVTINDPSGAGAAATAQVNAGSVTGVTVTNPGTGYIKVGIRKFTDALPGVCAPPDCPDYLVDPAAKYIPVAVPEKKMYNGIEADEYVIGLVQYRTSFSSSLPSTLVRGYVQLETAANAGVSQHFPVVNEMLDGAQVPVMQSDGVTQWLAVTPPQFLGPIIAATKNKPVRIVFYNLLPTDAGGDLFLPVDTSLMGSGMGPMDMGEPMNENSVMDEVRNPMCTDDPQMKHGGMDLCFLNNRATLHLHGGITPWISDGTAHQWITPANEMATWPEGVSVENVPDMNQCTAADDGCLTFYYTNQQSARLLFYHDHSWGITRLNVYAGEAAGYLITDATEQALIDGGKIPAAADTIPLIIQDKTFVPDAAQLAAQDPTWDVARWGSMGNFWYHHVYMPAQNPGDPSGMSAYGRWMYGPWFWPPAADTRYGPIDNPYYNMDPKGPDGVRGTMDDWTTPLAQPCNLDDPATWQYDTDPFCEPQQIPGTPNISVGMEQFNDTPVVNGVAYPTITLQPKAYRLRVLNAANDRFFNFQWYVGEAATASAALNREGQPIGATEVALNPAELELAQSDPTVFPTPIQSSSTAGPDWVQIGTEGGFLPAPVVVDGQQVTTWITDPTRFDVGNVDKHSLLLAPAERADVIVDFSRFAGKTLILYNDAPAAFPARVPSYDYYTGAPDLSPVGAPTILPGFGPNTRTIMQVKIADAPAATPFDIAGTTNDALGRLQAAFRHNAGGTGVFESGQHPIIVGQAAYNSAYGVSFASSSNCNAPGSTLQRCDGLVRVSDTQSFGFNTLRNPTSNKIALPLQPKAIHDEMNATTFDEFGRMQANLGIEAQPPTPGAQNVTLYPFVNPATELIDATNLPKEHVVYDANGLPVSDVKITPISDPADGTQIWRITHNGVDTHPIHFHLYDVQLVNRVTWDNIIIPADATELGWKDTVRVAPLEDTIVALRPIIPEVPFELPNAIRPLNPMMPLGSTAMFNNIDPQGNPTAAITNQLVNFGWEYVYHCHILSHEEMDMMRPVSVALPPNKPDGLAFNPATATLTWNDNSINETAFVVQRKAGLDAWADIGTINSPLDQANTHGMLSIQDPAYIPNQDYQYRVVAKNTIGYGAEYPSLTVQSVSAELTVLNPPAAPSNLAATLLAGPQVSLAWTDNATNETGFVIERSDNGSAFVQIGAAPAVATTGATGFIDANVLATHTYIYRVFATNAIGASGFSNQATILVPAPGPVPAAPTNLRATLQTTTGNPPRVSLNWRDNAANETGFQLWRSDNGGAPFLVAAYGPRAGVGNVTQIDATVAAGNTYAYYVIAFNANGPSQPSNTITVVIPPAPAAPINLSTTTLLTNGGTAVRLTVRWTDVANNETRYQIQRSLSPTFATLQLNTFAPANTQMYIMNNLALETTYYIRIRTQNLYGSSAWATITVTTP